MEKLKISTPAGDFIILGTLLKESEESRKKIYSIELLPERTEAILKSYQIRSEKNLKLAENEAKILSSISHKNIVKYLKSFQYIHPREGISYYGIALECCKGGNLEGLLERMRKKRIIFGIKILFNQIFALIEVLAFLQSKNVMHRDIKPENIFVVNDNELKLGDFDLGKEDNQDNLHTFQGSRDYLSPLLYESFLKLIQSSIYRIEHNVYKSDVYSLGLTFFYMATMNKLPKSESNRPILILSMVGGIQNLYLKKILEKMLAIQEIDRPDFTELNSFIQHLKNMTICASCFKKMDRPQCKCKKCCYGFHIKCIRNNNKCLTCESDLLCPKCTDNYILTFENCNHELCLKCHDNYYCDDKLEVIMNLESFVPDQPLLTFCVNCLNEIVELDCGPFCLNCNKYLCKICRFPHSENIRCYYANINSPIYCSCRYRLEFTQYSLFLDCSRCGFICRVCMKLLTESSHLQCSQLICHSLK